MSKSVRRVARLLSFLPVLLAFVAGPMGGGQAGQNPSRDSHARGARIEGRLVDGKGTTGRVGEGRGLRLATSWRARLFQPAGVPRPVPLGSAVTDAKGRFALANADRDDRPRRGDALGGRWGGLAVAVQQRPVALLLRRAPSTRARHRGGADETGVPLARPPSSRCPRCSRSERERSSPSSRGPSERGRTRRGASSWGRSRGQRASPHSGPGMGDGPSRSAGPRTTGWPHPCVWRSLPVRRFPCGSREPGPGGPWSGD
jgi:hypothetical protein